MFNKNIFKDKDPVAEAIAKITETSHKPKTEELKGNQKVLDKNKNNKLDAHDFAILRGEKKAMKEEEEVKESTNPFSKDYKSQMTTKPGEKAGFDSKKISTGTVYSRKHKPEDTKDDDKMKKEEVEQIDELKKSTLGSYVKKASSDAADKMHDAAAYANMSRKAHQTDADSGEWMSAAHKMHHKANLRQKGISKAVDKMSKEDADFSKKLIEGISMFSEAQLDEMINEVLGKDAKAGDWIHDFVHSKNPKFDGKSKAKRKEMALAAYYAKKRNEEVEQIEEWIDPNVQTVDTLKGREKVKKDDPLGKGGDFKSAKVKFLPDPVDVDEGKRPESDTVPFVTSENKPLERVKEMAKTSLKKMRSEMMGKAGTSE